MPWRASRSASVTGVSISWAGASRHAAWSHSRSGEFPPFLIRRDLTSPSDLASSWFGCHAEMWILQYQYLSYVKYSATSLDFNRWYTFSQQLLKECHKMTRRSGTFEDYENMMRKSLEYGNQWNTSHRISLATVEPQPNPTHIFGNRKSLTQGSSAFDDLIYLSWDYLWSARCLVGFQGSSILNEKSR